VVENALFHVFRSLSDGKLATTFPESGLVSRRPSLSAEDEALWRRITESVKPLRPRAQTGSALAVPTAPPQPLRRIAHPRSSAPSAKPAAPVADRGGEKRVRRGRVEIWGSLDLHGFTQDQARAALIGFLHRARADGARVVIVVTGKGRGGEMGVLKARTPDWLSAPELRPLVSGMAPAHAKHGGAGAMYVFLRRAED
jgi:DNA-nicking Smr family endonuclease